MSLQSGATAASLPMIHALDPVAGLVAQSCLRLDHAEYDKYLDLMTEDCRYSIRYYSPDLGRDMVLLDHDKPSLANLLTGIINHVTLPGRLLRQASVCAAETDAGGELAVISTIIVIHTDLDGTSRLFCAGRYHDRMRLDAGRIRLAARDVLLDTRDLGPGCHYPI
jgi:methanesulfonate monooxygenase small subunit